MVVLGILMMACGTTGLTVKGGYTDSPDGTQGYSGEVCILFGGQPACGPVVDLSQKVQEGK